MRGRVGDGAYDWDYFVHGQFVGFCGGACQAVDGMLAGAEE